jgi:hypothetical protein
MYTYLHFFDRVEGTRTPNHIAKDRVFFVQVRARAEGEVELRGVGVFPFVGHGEDTSACARVCMRERGRWTTYLHTLTYILPHTHTQTQSHTHTHMHTRVRQRVVELIRERASAPRTPSPLRRLTTLRRPTL